MRRTLFLAMILAGSLFQFEVFGTGEACRTDSDCAILRQCCSIATGTCSACLLEQNGERLREILTSNNDVDSCSAVGDPGCSASCWNGEKAICGDGLLHCTGCAGDGNDLNGTPGVCFCRDESRGFETVQ